MFLYYYNTNSNNDSMALFELQNEPLILAIFPTPPKKNTHVYESSFQKYSLFPSQPDDGDRQMAKMISESFLESCITLKMPRLGGGTVQWKQPPLS